MKEEKKKTRKVVSFFISKIKTFIKVGRLKNWDFDKDFFQFQDLEKVFSRQAKKRNVGSRDDNSVSCHASLVLKEVSFNEKKIFFIPDKSITKWFDSNHALKWVLPGNVKIHKINLKFKVFQGILRGRKNILITYTYSYNTIGFETLFQLIETCLSYRINLGFRLGNVFNHRRNITFFTI